MRFIEPFVICNDLREDKKLGPHISKILMSKENNKIDMLKMKLKKVTKMKLSKEIEVLKLRNKERLLTEEIVTIKNELSYLSEELEILKKQLAQSKHQIAMIEICGSSEDVKMAAHDDILSTHYQGYKQLFEKEQMEVEMRIKEEKEKELKNMEQVQQKELQLVEENNTREREIVIIEEECNVIERECAVLKKRNNAILLMLRKKLLETEKLRRERGKRTSK